LCSQIKPPVALKTSRTVFLSAKWHLLVAVPPPPPTMLFPVHYIDLILDPERKIQFTYTSYTRLLERVILFCFPIGDQKLIKLISWNGHAVYHLYHGLVKAVSKTMVVMVHAVYKQKMITQLYLNFQNKVIKIKELSYYFK